MADEPKRPTYRLVEGDVPPEATYGVRIRQLELLCKVQGDDIETAHKLLMAMAQRLRQIEGKLQGLRPDD